MTEMHQQGFPSRGETDLRFVSAITRNTYGLVGAGGGKHGHLCVQREVPICASGPGQRGLALQVHGYVKLRRCIVDEGCVLPEGFSAGFDAAQDGKRFHVSAGGVTLITPEMLGQPTSRADGQIATAPKRGSWCNGKGQAGLLPG